MKPRVIAMGALAFAIAQCLSGLAAADTAATPGETTSERNELPKVEVRERRSDDTRPKLQHIMKEVDGPLITVTKKTSITKLDSIPTVVDNNLRALFAQTPGLFVSEQQSPGQANLSYRGIGNPQESEFVTVGFVIAPSIDAALFMDGLHRMGPAVFFASRDNAVFDYDETVSGVAGEGTLVATVGQEGTLALPFITDALADEFLSDSPDLDTLIQASLGPARTIAWP